MKFNSVVWIVTAVLIYFIFLIAYLPAKQVIGRLDLPANISVSGVAGSIWRAKAASVSVNGININQVDWHLSALPLLLGKANLQINGGNARAADEVSVDGNVSLSLAQLGMFKADELTAFLPTDLMVSQLPLPVPVLAQGRVRLDIQSLNYNKSCQSLTGKLRWLNATVGSNAGLVNLGSFDADLTCNQGSTLVKINEPNLLGLSANARLDAKLNYSIEGRFKPDASLPKSVHDASVIFGRRDAEGYYQLKL